VTVYTCNPSYLKDQGRRISEFKASLGYIVRLCLKIKNKNRLGTKLSDRVYMHKTLGSIPSTPRKKGRKEARKEGRKNRVKRSEIRGCEHVLPTEHCAHVGQKSEG
jgi:hypothetical protein